MKLFGFESPPREVVTHIPVEGNVDRIGSYTESRADAAWTVFVVTLEGDKTVYEFVSRYERALALTRPGDRVAFQVSESRSYEGDLLRTRYTGFVNHAFADAPASAVPLN